MSRNGVRNWPPAWTWMRGGKDKHPRGEVGILKEVVPSQGKPEDRCFLIIAYQGSEYLGCLLFNDEAFCRQIMELLKAHCNRSIAEIGGLEISHTL